MSRFEDFIERQPKPVVALAATALHGLLYMLPNRVHLVPPRELAFTAIDKAVPFLPWTAYVYWSDYLLVFVAFVGITVRGNTARFVYALFTAILFSVAVHWVFPVVYPRELFPLPPGTDPVTAFLFSRFRQLDTAASCFPSLHVAASYLAAYSGLRESRRRGVLLFLWATAVAIATLTTRQHYFVDVIAGMAVAAGVAAVFYGGAAIRARPSPTRGSSAAP